MNIRVNSFVINKTPTSGSGEITPRSSVSDCSMADLIEKIENTIHSRKLPEDEIHRYSSCKEINGALKWTERELAKELKKQPALDKKIDTTKAESEKFNNLMTSIKNIRNASTYGLKDGVVVKIGYIGRFMSYVGFENKQIAAFRNEYDTASHKKLEAKSKAAAAAVKSFENSYERDTEKIETRIDKLRHDTEIYKEFFSKTEKEYNEKKIREETRQKEVDNEIKIASALLTSALLIDVSSLKKPEYFREIKDIYTANAAFIKINSALRNKENPGLKGKDIIQELKKRHGDEVFSRGAAKHQQRIESAANGMNLKTLQAFAFHSYQNGLNGGIGRHPVELYRGQDMTKKGLQNFQKFREAKTPIHPTAFLSCDHKETTAYSFAKADSFAKAEEDKKIPVFFKIEAITHVGMKTSLAANEESEALLTPFAQFKIINIELIDGMNHIHLKELLPSEYQNMKSEDMPY